MASGRSLLSQLEQIAGSYQYDDIISGINTGSVSEPADSTVSGSLEYDLNIVRAHLRQIKDWDNDWYDPLSTYDLAVDGTTVSGSLKELASPSHGTGNVLDAKSIILPVERPLNGTFITVSGGATGVLEGITTQYADSTDRRGLPIYDSVGNVYYDEGGSDNVVRIDVLDSSTGQEFTGSNGEVVFARFHDGADFAGTGDGTDVYVRFYTVSGTYSWDAGDPASIKIVYPQRKILSEMEEWEWLRTDFVSSWEGDVELIEDIYNLWQFTGAGDGITSPTWNNTTAYYMLDGNPSDLEAGINDINDGIGDRDFTTGNYYAIQADGQTITQTLEDLNLAIGDRDYTEENYVTDGETLTASIDALDMALWDLETTVSGVAAPQKYVYTTPTPIPKNTLWNLKYSTTYTPFSSDTQPGKNMDVYVDGQLLAADYSTAGDNDYEETTASGITFHFRVRRKSNITWVIRS
jgi:hypothetical protein